MTLLQKLLTLSLFIVLGSSLFAQQYNVKTASKCIASDGDTVMLYFQGVPSPAGAGTITFTYAGDLDLTGTSGERFDFYSENGALLTQSTSTAQCGAPDSITYNIPVDSLIDWSSDGIIFFIADATPAVTASLCTPGTCTDARLSYPFITVPNDIRASKLVAPRNFCGGTQDIIVEIANSGTNQVTNAQVNWTYDGALQTAVPFAGLLDTLGGLGSPTAQVTLGSRNFQTGIPHTIQVWTSLPNGVVDGNLGNDTLPVQQLQPALAGTFTIGGATGDYPDLTAAAADLAQYGVCGPVTFSIASGTYTEQVLLASIDGASQQNPIVFKSATGNAADVTITTTSATSAANYVIQFNNAAHITLQGLTIVNGGATYGTGVRMEGNCSRLTIEDCIIEGGYRNSTSSNQALIFANGNKCDSIWVQNNELKGGSYGMYFRASSGNNGVGNRIINNVVETYYRGLSIYYQDALIVAENTITSNTYATYNSYYALELGTCDQGAQVVGNVINAETGNNGIYFVSSKNTAGNQALVANNMVHIGGSGIANGIYLLGTHDYTQVYHNSVNISNTSTGSAAIYVTASGSNISIVNNIFNNENGGYAVDYSSNSSLGRVDYNLLNAGGSNFAYYGFSTYSDFAAYQLGSGLDANGISFVPPFVSSTDLHVSPIINETGTPLVAVPFDIDGEPRDPVKPDVGADEVVPGPIDMATLRLLDPVSGCGLSAAEKIGVIYVSYGNDPVTVGTSIPVSYSIDGAPPVTENMVVNKVLNFNDTIVYYFKTTADLGVGGDYQLTLSVNIPNDSQAGNNTLSETVTNNSSPGLPQFIDFENWGPISTDPSCSSTGATALQGWTQDDEDDGNWNINSGPTPTATTGPVVDFLPGSTNGKYLYVESEFPCYGAGYEVNLLSPCLDLATMQRPGLNFAYHMYGSTMGSLHVDIVRGSLVIPNAWTVSGDQGSSWQQAAVDLSRYANFGEVRIRIRAIIGSSSTGDIAIDDLRLGELPNVELGNGPIVDCGFVELDTRVNNATYQWNTGDTTRSIRIVNTGNQPNTGVYSVIVTKNGLYSFDSIEVTLDPGPNIDLGPDVLTVCEVDTVTLDAGNPGFKHQWENGFFAQKRLIDKPGTYWVTVDDLKGCVRTDTIEVQFNETPTASFTHANVTNLSRLLFVAAGSADNDYLWDFGDGSGSTVQEATHLYANGGNYTVTLIVSNDCGADTTSQVINVWPTSVTETNANQSLALSPNPTEGIVNVELQVATPGDWTAEILNIAGQVVANYNLGMVQEQYNATIDVGYLAKGIYLFRLSSQEGQLLQRLVVQ